MFQQSYRVHSFITYTSESSYSCERTVRQTGSLHYLIPDHLMTSSGKNWKTGCCVLFSSLDIKNILLYPHSANSCLIIMALEMICTDFPISKISIYSIFAHKIWFWKLLSLPIAVWWRSMTSDILVTIGWVNGLSLLRRQTTTQTNANKLSIGSLFQEPMSVKFKSKYRIPLSRKCVWKCRQQNVGHFV